MHFSIEQWWRILTVVLRVASARVGVGVGLGTARLTTGHESISAPQGPSDILNQVFLIRPTFATWQCALFGAGAAVTLCVALSLVNSLTNALRVLSVPVGVGVRSLDRSIAVRFYTALYYGRCTTYIGGAPPAVTFAPWQCALFGAGAAVVVLAPSPWG